MTNFQRLIKHIEEGKTGVNEGIPTGLDKLDDYISIRKKLMITVFGATGSGKSTLTNQAFVLNPFEYAVKKNLNIKVVVFSMERSIIFTHAKWLCCRIFRDDGRIIPVGKLLGWYKNNKVTDEELELINNYESYYDRMEEIIDVYEGQKSPEKIEQILKNYITGYEHVIVVFDHLGLTKTAGHGSKKNAIDRLIEIGQEYRDNHDFTIINVSQVNRDLSKNGKDVFEPHLDHLKESGNVSEASDIVMSIFDPIRYNTKDPIYGDVNKFKCPRTGHKFFRNISVLKNTYGIDGVGVGTVFMGETGILKTLPKSTEVSEWLPEHLNNIFNYNYFLM